MTTAGPDVSVRLAWVADASAIAAVQLAAWSTEYDHVRSEIPSADDLTQRWSELISSPRDARIRVLVALDRATVRGLMLLTPSYDPDSDQIADAEIAEFVVDPDHLGAGHGSRLLQAAADTLRADEFKRVTWWMNTNADIQRAFATSAGWEPDGASRELQSAGDARLKQVRLHCRLVD